MEKEGSKIIRRTKKENHISTRNVRIDDKREKLLLEKTTEKYEISYEKDMETGKTRQLDRKLVEKKVDHVSYKLWEVSREQLLEFRKEGKPGFVFKENGELYYAKIPKKMSFVSLSSMGAHLCGLNGAECKRLSAACDEDGGCAKVRNKARFIECYPWIKVGFETFGVTNHSLIVLQCDKYSPIKYQERTILMEN